MPVVAHYPATRHDPPAPVDLSDRAERARLSPGAIRAFLNIMACWGVGDVPARQLLGGVANGTYYTMKRDPDRVLEEDRLRRISYLIGIYKALHTLYGETLADRWMTLPNTNRIFAGATPLDYLIRGGLPAFQIVRRLLDARRAGQ
jgi:hypothetical protein